MSKLEESLKFTYDSRFCAIGAWVVLMLALSGWWSLLTIPAFVLVIMAASAWVLVVIEWLYPELADE